MTLPDPAPDPPAEHPEGLMKRIADLTTDVGPLTRDDLLRAKDAWDRENRPPPAEHRGAMTTGATPAPSKPCTHDSKRADGYLDTHCLGCGLDGYWRKGCRVIDDVKTHPSGKLLIKLRIGLVGFIHPEGMDAPDDA